MLPGWPLSPPSAAPVELASFLDEPGVSVSLAIKGQSDFLEGCPEHGHGVPLQAIQVGNIWLRGPAEGWIEGGALKLAGDSRLCRIIRITEFELRLIFDSKSQPQFLWLFKSDVNFSMRQWLQWSVYNIRGIARAINHTSFAPGD